MEPRVNYIVVGIFVIVLTTILVITVIWLSTREHVARVTYAVYMNEAVTGLSPQAAVKFNGVDVGYVSDISINEQNPQQVRLLLSIDKSVPINQSTTASLMSQGVTGITYIGLKATASTAPPLTIMPGEKYPVIAYAPSFLVKLDTVLSSVADNMKVIKNELQKLFSPDNQQALHDSLQNITKITDNFANNSDKINATINNASRTLQTSGLAVQKVSQQVIPDITQMVNQLNVILRNIQQVTNTMKTNPAVLIRGQVSPPKGPGE